MKLIYSGIFWLTILVIVVLPDLKRISDTPEGSFYPIIHKEPADYYGYLSYIRQGRRQNYLVNQHTTRYLPPSLLHNYYMLLGKIGKITNLSDIYMYRLGLYLPLLLYCLYSVKLVTLLIPPKYKWPALFLIFFTSPFPEGNLTIFGREINFGAEWWTGLDVYNRLTLKPHHFMATSLMLAAVFYFLKYLKSRKLTFLILTGILMLPAMIFFAMPTFILFWALMALLFFYLAIFIYRYLKKQPYSKAKLKEIMTAAFFILSILLVMYFVNHEAKKSDLVAWESIRLNSPQDSLLKLTYRFFLPLGVLPVFFIPALFYIYQKRRLEYLFPLIMVAVAYLLFILSAKGFIPLPMIRMVYYAPYVFGGLTAASGIIYLIEKISRKGRKKIFMTGLFFLFLTNAVLGLKSYWWPELLKKEIYLNTYIPGPYLRAMDFLNANTPRYSHVMTTFYAGMFIPAFTHNKVYIGHEAVPDDFSYLWWTAENFMKGKFPPEVARKFLMDNRISYVFWDQGELPPEYGTLMEPVYNKEGITIFVIN